MKYGYKRGLADHRDHRYAFSGDPQSLLENYNLPGYDSIFDQENIGSCLPNAADFALVSWMIRNKYPYQFIPSRLKLYYDCRFMDGDPEVDSGTDARTLFKVMNSLGVCPENENSNWNWAYDITKFTEKPPPQCYTDAKLHKLVKYAWVNQDQLSIKSAVQNGFNLVIGISVFQQIESAQAAKTGIIDLPSSSDAPIDGHGLCVSGFDKKYVIGPNSWSDKWGDHGYYYLPWDYILNPDLCSDIVSVGMVT